jgi:hypothetical protein
MAVGYTKIKDFKGVNFTDPPTEIADDEFVMARNMWAGKRGYIGPRPVQRIAEKQFNSDTGLFENETKIGWIPWATGANDGAFGCGLYQFIDANQKHRVVACIPFEWPNGAAGAGPVQYDPMMVFLHTAQSGFYFPDADPTVVWRHDATFSNAVGRYFPRLNGAPSRPVSLVFNNELYLFLGHTVPGLVLGAADFPDGNMAPKFRRLGAAWTTGSGATGDNFKFSFGDVYRNVFVLGGLPAPYESVLAFTEPGDTPNTLVEVAKWTGVGFGDGDKLIRVKTAPIVGGSDAVEPYVMAFKSRSVWLVQGFTPSTTDEGNLTMTPIMRREGLVAPHAVCETPYGLVWCSGRNVWLMPPGTEPKSIGDKIKGLLETLPQTPVDAWFMEFRDDVLYLNFPSPRGLVSGNEYGRAASATYARTYLPSQQMWCDLRKPDEPRWWGPQDVRCSHMLSLNFPDGPKQLAGLTPYWEDTASYRVQPFTMAETGIDSQDGATGAVISKGYDLADPGVSTGLTNQVNPPCSTYQVLRSREFDFGDDNLEKIIEALELNAWWDIGLGAYAGFSAANDRPFDLAWYKNGGQGAAGAGEAAASTPSRGTGTFEATDPGALGFTLGFNQLGSGAGALKVQLADTFIPITVFPASSSRFIARTFQFEVFGIQTNNVPLNSVDDTILRRFMFKSFTLRVRPIGRRPGGSL